MTCKVVTGQSPESGGGGAARVSLQLRLTRRHRLYAAARRVARPGRTDVRLHNRRRLTRGRYTLSVRVGDTVIVRVPLRIR